MRWGSWGLYIGGEGMAELFGYYGSAFAAADSYMRSIGWNGWDRRKRIHAMPTLPLWSKKLVKRFYEHRSRLRRNQAQ